VSKPYSLIVTDTSPLFTLVLAGWLDVLLRPGLLVRVSDAISVQQKEATRRRAGRYAPRIGAQLQCEPSYDLEADGLVIAATLSEPPRNPYIPDAGLTEDVVRNENGVLPSDVVVCLCCGVTKAINPSSLHTLEGPRWRLINGGATI